jgi:serine phosphatase RsbU (regulator of sigma subunit)
MKKYCIIIIIQLLSWNLFPVNHSSDSLIKKSIQTYQNDPELGYRYAYQAYNKALLEKNTINSGIAIEMIGVSLDYLGYLDSALFYFDKSIAILSKQNDKKALARVFKSKANSLCLLNKNKEALSYYTEALGIMKAEKNKKEEASLLMGIGNVYSSMKFYELSIDYYQQSMSIFEEMKDSISISYLLTNISEVYAAQNNQQKEYEYQLKSLKIKERLKNNDYGIIYSYVNMSQIMTNFNKEDSAIFYAQSAIDLSKKINNLDFLCSSYKSLAYALAHFGDYSQALKYYDLTIDLAQKLKNIRLELDAIKLKSDALIKSGKYEEATQALIYSIALNDSVNNIETKKSFNELQTQYETEKKEKEIEILNERDKKRNLLIYASFIFVLLLIILSITLYNRFRLKRQTAVELELRNNEIEKQKHLVDEKQKEILDSINYAKRIQYALLAHDSLLQKNLPEHFILFKPKDIVSGYFYWATEYNQRFYIAICDSTGHGVPGAFMSLLNIGFLNEAIKEKKLEAPHEILNHVRKRLTESISDDKQRDGMDAILLCINRATKQITYSAANNEPVLIQQNKTIVLPKDKMPVGKGEVDMSFTTNEIAYEGGEMLYLYTDGYADQFGGPNGKKFKYKQLNELLNSISHKPIDEQRLILDHTFMEWKKNLEQIDDVLIAGIKLS